MNDLTLNENVFIRSMGTRGSLGGLSKKTADVVKLMDAFGMDLIIIETVGVGQSEVDIVKNADTTLVVLVPGLGDDIQAIKGGYSLKSAMYLLSIKLTEMVAIV